MTFLGSLLLVLALSSCQAQVPPSHPEAVDQRLWTAVRTFEEEFNVRVRNEVRVEDLSRFDQQVDGFPVYAACGIYSGVVRIDPRTLQRGWSFIELRVWHELGHCVFGLPHVNEPCSVMRANGASHDFARQFERNRQCFVDHMRKLTQEEE